MGILPVDTTNWDNQMLNDCAMMINRLAQGLVPVEAGISWFAALAPADRQCAMQTLWLCCDQSGILPSDVDAAISLAGLKPTFTPCVMLKKAARPRLALESIIALPENEQLKSFRLLLALFAIADKRRRETRCKDGCQHEWHHIQ